MTRHFSFRYHEDGSEHGQVLLNINETHWWWDVPIHVADAICAFTRHRFCSKLVLPAYDLSSRHVRHKLDVAVDRSSWVKWAEMTGDDDPSWWWEDKE